MANIEVLDYTLRKRNRSCFVYGCFSTAANKPQIGFHKFPSKGKRNIIVIKKNGDKCIYDRRQVWIEALNIGREAALAIDGVDIYVCSLHFARDDFYYNQDITGRRYLKERAIPRRNLPARNTSWLTTKFNVRPLNRLKYRGYFNIHNPDGRKLTAPRRFLGASALKEASQTGGQSYTKTVWVVRKPFASKDQAQDNSINDGISVASTFSLADNAQAGDPQEETEEDEQCTILETESLQQGNNPWFTSELIIKEEPISDSEQEASEAMMTQKVEEPDDSKVTFGIINNEDGDDDDEDDNSYEPNKLVIQTEEEENDEPIDQQSVSEPEQLDQMQHTEKEGIESMEIGEHEQTEEYEETEYAHQSEEPKDDTVEYYEDEEDEPQGDYDVIEIPDDDSQEGYFEEGLCHICGTENCIGHPKSRTRENYFVCLICSEIFPSQTQLAIHSMCHQEMSEEEILMHEEKTKSLTCEFCDRVLSTKATLREHIMIHTGEKPHQCLLCGRSFRHKANLVVHVNGHAVVSNFKCKKCNQTFNKRMDFEKHLKYHVDESGLPLVCKICNAVFKSQRTLYNHSMLHSRKGNVRAKKRSAAHRDPVHVCKICGKILSTKATLKEHTMIHTGEKPHECPICGRTIRHKANYVVHVQTHGQGKCYECDMCNEVFMRRSDLTQHKQLSHTTSKLIRCPICSEIFKSPQKFNRHMEVHESVVYMNETEELNGFEPHLLEGFFED